MGSAKEAASDTGPKPRGGRGRGRGRLLSVINATLTRTPSATTHLHLALVLAAGERAHRLSRTLRRRKSSFLYTHSHPPGHGSGHALYYLPHKLTPEQEDTLDSQEDTVDAQIEDDDEHWERRRESITTRIDQIA